MLRPPDPRVRARILNYGQEGTGKSSGWLSIAQWCYDTGSDAQFYVCDTDDSAETMIVMGGYPEDNIHVTNVNQWEDFEAWAKMVRPQIRPKHDWMVIDFAGTAWEAVQDWYIENTRGMVQSEYFMSVREQGDKALDGWTDWQYINKEYRDFMNPIVYETSAHLYMTAQATKVGDRDARELKQLYSSVGYRAVGQKALGYQAHSVLYSNALKIGDVYMTTLKDLRGVDRLSGTKISDFTLDYLVGAAKWQL